MIAYRVLIALLCCTAVMNARTLAHGDENDEMESRSRTTRATHVVTIREFQFHPSEIEIQVGDSVVWVNEDSAPHTATRTDAPAFDTGLLQKDDEKAIEFSEPSPDSGFDYFCAPHPFMTGKVKVLLAGSQLSTSHKKDQVHKERQSKTTTHPAPQVVEVRIKDTAPYFVPNPVEIHVGDSVKWINDGQAPHTATRRESPAFNTGILTTGQSATVRFDAATSGVGIPYLCIPHPYMTGSVVVKLRGSHLLGDHAHGKNTPEEKK